MKKKFYILLPVATLFLLTGCDGVPIIKKHCTLKFNSNGGTSVSEERIDIFTVPTEPANPSKDGYDFLGWYYDNKTFEYRFNFEKKLCQDVTLYAKWEPTPAVTFISTTLYTNELTAPKGCDYTAKIRLKDECSNSGFEIPSEKAYYLVTINGSVFEDFTIEPSLDPEENTMKLHIDFKYITGPITIQTEAFEDYLTFANSSDSEVTLKRNIAGSISIANDWSCEEIDVASESDPTPVTWSKSENEIKIPSGHALRILSSNATTLSTSASNYLYFSTQDNASLIVSGDVMSLINHGQLTNYCFFGLFKGFNFAAGSKLYLPSSSLMEHCYHDMFKNAQGLSATPILPATEVPDSAYYSMFEGCKGLTGGDLSAVTLSNNSLNSMFKGAEDLETIKVGFGTKDSLNWPNQTDCTKDWLPEHTPLSRQVFIWKGTTNMFEIERSSIYYSTSRIPGGWSVINLF